MDKYIDELAPWEVKSEFYNDIQLGSDVNTLIELIRNKTTDMVSSRVKSASQIIISQKRTDEVIGEIDYGPRIIAQGIFGLKAAFEWGISDVVWQIEKEREKIKELVDPQYTSLDAKAQGIKKEADGAYANGELDEALEHLLELEKHNKFDFSAFITLGIIFLFHKIDRERAFNYFDKALKAKPRSAYYKSYALLYKALIRRDIGRIEDAQEFSKEAMGLSSDFTEAIYQNAQYNALLNKPEITIPLLRNVINDDIVYCLKMVNEKDFDGIKPEVTKLFEEIKDTKEEEVKNKMRKIGERVYSFNNTISSIEKLGYEIPKSFHAELPGGESSEVDEMLNSNAIFDAHMANLHVSQRESIIQRKKSALRDKCLELQEGIDKEIYARGGKLLEEKKTGGIGAFILRFLLGQFVAVPLGFLIGIPLGIYIMEGFLFILCMLWVILPARAMWKNVYDLQTKKDFIAKVVERL